MLGVLKAPRLLNSKRGALCFCQLTSISRLGLEENASLSGELNHRGNNRVDMWHSAVQASSLVPQVQNTIAIPSRTNVQMEGLRRQEDSCRFIGRQLNLRPHSRIERNVDRSPCRRGLRRRLLLGRCRRRYRRRPAHKSRQNQNTPDNKPPKRPLEDREESVFVQPPVERNDFPQLLEDRRRTFRLAIGLTSHAKLLVNRVQSAVFKPLGLCPYYTLLLLKCQVVFENNLKLP